jgi:hypothetical protein
VLIVRVAAAVLPQSYFDPSGGGVESTIRDDVLMEVAEEDPDKIPSRGKNEHVAFSPCSASSREIEESENDDDRSIEDGLEDDIGGRINILAYSVQAVSKMQQLTMEEEKTWTTLDSVHSKASTRFDQGCHASFNNSTESFNSFGGSSGTLDAYDLEELRESQAEFKKLDESASSNRLLDSDLSKQRRQFLLTSRSASTRMMRGPSFRGSLTLINEDGLD